MPHTLFKTYYGISHLGFHLNVKIYLNKIIHLSKDTSSFTHCLHVSSADNLYKQFGPDQAQQNVRPDLDRKLFDNLM